MAAENVVLTRSASNVSGYGCRPIASIGRQYLAYVTDDEPPELAF
jgi:hypothetical protein